MNKLNIDTQIDDECTMLFVDDYLNIYFDYHEEYDRLYHYRWIDFKSFYIVDLKTDLQADQSIHPEFYLKFDNVAKRFNLHVDKNYIYHIVNLRLNYNYF